MTIANVHPRENNLYYIPIDETQEKAMLEILGHKNLDDLYAHIDDNNKFSNFTFEKNLNQTELKKHVEKVAATNQLKTSFLGDGLQQFAVTDVVAPICNIRGLTTAYTPYQPERSQGTLQTLWIYQSVISELTGFEAVNASLYERSTCLYEAIQCALRLKKNTNKVIVAENLYPGDLEVLHTLATSTNTEIMIAPIDKSSGKLDLLKLKELITSDVAALAFPQLSTFGVIENINELTDLCSEAQIKSIALIEPFTLAPQGLKAPILWGTHQQGVDMIVAEGQHLAIGPNFGGPGLGIFAIRYNEKDTLSIRSTAGRFIGKTKDLKGRDCKALILSTREQHIRREKATSNICSNQSFIATAAGASMLRRGASGFQKSFELAHNHAKKAYQFFSSLEGVQVKFQSAFFNELTIEFPTKISDLIASASTQGIHIGVDLSGRAGVAGNLLKISFNDSHTEDDLQKLFLYFQTEFKTTKGQPAPVIASNLMGNPHFTLKSFGKEELINYYQALGKQNLSPDEGIYPLGSCTMKYNPYINDYAAGLQGFTDTHPQAPLSDCQGNLAVLYYIQESFKKITGLPGVTTQPVAGAQGELVGLKLFQAYHLHHKQNRNLVLIPRSAHGTNPATATYAGLEIITIEANPDGRMNLNEIKKICEERGSEICGVMVTNPNTAGVFESEFRQMSELIHKVGGLVYMDGANMNAIAGYIDLSKIGVDAVHNNLHKTWTIPHGGGGPGDAMVAVSEKLIDFLPGHQITLKNNIYDIQKTKYSIGSFHRHFGNFAHKIRCYTYIKALGGEGIKKMSAIAVLSARYLYKKLETTYPYLPTAASNVPRMHEFIVTFSPDTFERIQKAGVPKALIIARVGKLFLDFGFHAPTVAFPEPYGLMIEPTESYSQNELDGFANVVKAIHTLINEYPQVLLTVPHFTPIDRVDEVTANKTPLFSEKITQLEPALPDRVENQLLRDKKTDEIIQLIVKAHEEEMKQV